MVVRSSRPRPCTPATNCPSASSRLRAAAASLRRVGPVVVPGGVDFVEVDTDKRRALLDRPCQPAEHLGHAVPARAFLVVGQPLRRPHACDFHLGSRPEHRRRAAALADARHPDGFAAPPARVFRRCGRHRERRGIRRIDEGVRDDAVVRRVEPGDDGVVVRKRERGKRRNQFRRAHAARREGVQVGESGCASR